METLGLLTIFIWDEQSKVKFTTYLACVFSLTFNKLLTKEDELLVATLASVKAKGRQGSILGLSLFLICINDLLGGLPTSAKLFAYDINSVTHDIDMIWYVNDIII